MLNGSQLFKGVVKELNKAAESVGSICKKRRKKQRFKARSGAK